MTDPNAKWAILILGEPRLCDTEVSDYGNLDCQCPGLRLCAACEGDPEAHGRHICGRDDG